MSRRAVQVRITNELLGKLLQLPEGQRVSAVLPLDGPDILHGTFRVVIEGEHLPICPEGVEPVYTKLQFGPAI